MFELFKSSKLFPSSYGCWIEVDVIAGSESLHKGPTVRDVREFKQWLHCYERWRAGYNAFVKAASALDGDGFRDDFDRRQYEHYAGLFLQSGQWRAILLMLVEDVPAPERSRYLAEVDGFLADLRERIAKR